MTLSLDQLAEALGGEVLLRGNLKGKQPDGILDPAWARALRDECAAQGVSFFMKQMTKRAPIPDDLMVRQISISEAAARRGWR